MVSSKQASTRSTAHKVHMTDATALLYRAMTAHMESSNNNAVAMNQHKL